MNYTEIYKVDVPEGASGNWRIEKFEVSEKDAEMQRMRSMFNGGRGVPVGSYTKLVRGSGGFGGTIVMSDTPDEIRDHLGPITEVKRIVYREKRAPSVLIHGLGLGMIARAVLKEGASSVTVVEKSPDVIALTGPWLKEQFGDRVTIIEGDALDWKPERGARWDVVWHDIWDNICSDNLEGMKTLHRRFGRRSLWQGSWCRWRCEQQAKGWR